MDIIRAGIKLSRTIRNVGRLREIVSIFAKNGFDEFVSFGMTASIPNFVLPKSRVRLKEELESSSEKDWNQVVGFRLRKCFEELGPAFIKFGQLLSSREDMFDTAFIDEMKLLRDKVKGVPFAEIKEVVEKSLGASITDIFSEIDPDPIGTASIGVVYKGRLRSGEDIVIKVRRPNIEKMIETDFSILLFLASQAEKASREVKYLGISRMIVDFAATIHTELNFNIEMLNSDRLRKNLSNHDSQKYFYLPKMYPQYTRDNILVMERLKGIPFTDTVQIEKVKDSIAKQLEIGLKIFIKTFLQDGFFHADLHGGNFFLLENGQIGIIDFGLTGNLGKKARLNFIALLYAMITNNYENLVYEFLNVAEYGQTPDVDELIRDVRDSLSQFVGLTVSQTNFSLIMKSIIKTLSRHQIYIPREWFVVFRGLMTLDGVGRSIGFDFDIFEALENDIHNILKVSLKKDDLIEEAVWAGRDILSSARMFPRHLKWFIKDLAKSNYSFRIIHTGHEEKLAEVSGSIAFLGFAILSGIFFASGVFVLGQGQITGLQSIPGISWIFWGMGAMTFAGGFRALRI